MIKTLTLTEEEMKIVRSALCHASMKALRQAMDAEKEEKEKGLGSGTSQIFNDYHDEIKAIIARIDEE